MARYEYKIRSLETDRFDNVKPKTMLRIAIDAVSRQSDYEGVSFDRMEKLIGAVWMLARLRYEQYLTVRGGETIFAEVSSRSISGGTYTRVIRFTNAAGELAALSTMASMAVEKQTRHILRTKTVEELFSEAPMPDEGRTLKRIRIREELPLLGHDVVKYGDCDMNGHLSGPSYADVVCEALGYWKDGPKLCQELQIDYSAECPPETVLSLRGRSGSDGFVIQGIRQDGVISFSSEGRFRDIDC